MGYKTSNKKNVSAIEPLCRKPMYNSAEEAQDMIKYLKENKGVREIYVYRCTECGFWHLTKKSK
jgi:hypothetical protein